MPKEQQKSIVYPNVQNIAIFAVKRKMLPLIYPIKFLNKFITELIHTHLRKTTQYQIEMGDISCTIDKKSPMKGGTSSGGGKKRFFKCPAKKQ